MEWLKNLSNKIDVEESWLALERFNNDPIIKKKKKIVPLIDTII